VYNNLKHNLFTPEDSKAFMADGLNKLLEQLQGAYRCLGITCADVGEYKKGLIPECVDPILERIVGYTPMSDVTEVRSCFRVSSTCNISSSRVWEIFFQLNHSI